MRICVDTTILIDVLKDEFLSDEEAIEKNKEAIRLHVEDLLENGESIEVSDRVSLTSLEVAV